MLPSRFHRSTSNIGSLLLSVTACLILAGTNLSQPPPFEQAKTINAPQPVFPDEAKNFIYGDSITVSIDVDKKGKVTKARAWGPLAPCSNLNDKVASAINKAALAAAKATVLEPIQKDGKPVEATLKVTYPLLPSGTPKTLEAGNIFEEGVLNGKALHLPKPELPPMARLNRTSGSVGVQVLIGGDGKVLSAAAISGHPYLQEGALESACGARFAKTELRGQPVRVTGVITYHFVF